jgi:hypothetical protein
MKFYDWRKTLTTVNGVPVTNFASGDDAFKAERLADNASHEVGVDGNMVVSLSADKSGQVTIKLQQTSPTNSYLNKITTGQDHMEGFVPVVVQQQDVYRNDGVGTTVGYIKKHPDYTRGAKASTVEWVFIFEQLHMQLGDPPFAGVPTSIAEALG